MGCKPLIFIRSLLFACLLLAVGFSPSFAGSDPEAEEGSDNGKGLFVTLDPLIIPVIENGVVRRHITLQLQLEMTDLEADRRLQGRYHHLVDAFFAELYALMSMRYVREKGMDIEFFRKRLQLRADRMLGKGTVKNILVRDVMERVPVRNQG